MTARIAACADVALRPRCELSRPAYAMLWQVITCGGERPRRRLWRVSFVCAFLAFGSVVSLTGCETVAGAGSTGMSVDGQGRPVVVFALCNDHIDGATVYRDRTAADPAGDDSTVSVADWDAVSPITPDSAINASLNTVEPSAAWRRTSPPVALKPGVLYVAYGWTRDSTWYTGHVEFTLERLSNLKPGQVLSQTYVEANDRSEDRVQPYSQFAAEKCA